MGNQWNREAEQQTETAGDFSRYRRGHEIMILLERYRNCVGQLQFMTALDYRLFSGFMTLQLVLGAWLSSHPIAEIGARLGLICIDGIIAALAGKLLYNNYRRRQEVVVTLQNLNAALGYTESGAFISKKAIDEPVTFRPWWYWYLVGIVVTFIGLLIVVFCR